MNAKTGHVVNLYGAALAIERKLRKVNEELSFFASQLTEKEMGEYIAACEKIDAKYERKEAAR